MGSYTFIYVYVANVLYGCIDVRHIHFRYHKCVLSSPLDLGLASVNIYIHTYIHIHLYVFSDFRKYLASPHYMPSTRASDNCDQNCQAEFIVNITIPLKKRTGRDYREKGTG
jgi:hypothetical protein